jgi:hypothetical protein
LLWAVEVLRRRRLPRSSAPLANQVALSHAQQRAVALESLNLAAEASATAAQWGGRFQPNLPHDAAGRLGLALKIEGMLCHLPPASSQLLRLWAWGDWADESRLHAALVHQEKLRRQGIRARLSYRYSTAQLALLAGVSKATLWRQLQAALTTLETALTAQDLVSRIHTLQTNERPIAKPVSRQDFGKSCKMTET